MQRNWFACLLFVTAICADDNEVCSCRVPPLALANGGKTDFRGHNATLFNFLTSRNVSVNVRFAFSTFQLDKLIVHGSFITDAHIVAMGKTGRIMNVSYDASFLNDMQLDKRVVRGVCGKKAFSLGQRAKMECDGIRVSTNVTAATVETGEWIVRMRGLPVRNRLSGPFSRVDVECQPTVSHMHVLPHGLVGQSFDEGNVPREGKMDVYPPHDVPSEFTTIAMGEGAIEGHAAHYAVRGKYDTAYRFSRFGEGKGWNASSIAYGVGDEAADFEELGHEFKHFRPSCCDADQS